MVTSRRWEAAQLPWSGGYLEKKKSKQAGKGRKPKSGPVYKITLSLARSLARKRIE
jgi:hypothetical protein